MLDKILNLFCFHIHIHHFNNTLMRQSENRKQRNAFTALTPEPVLWVCSCQRTTGLKHKHFLPHTVHVALLLLPGLFEGCVTIATPANTVAWQLWF